MVFAYNIILLDSFLVP